jgi:hypothetical protein
MHPYIFFFHIMSLWVVLWWKKIIMCNCRYVAIWKMISRINFFDQQKFKWDKNEVPKRKIYSKMWIFLIRLDFHFPKDKKEFFYCDILYWRRLLSDSEKLAVLFLKFSFYYFLCNVGFKKKISWCFYYCCNL